MKKNVVHMNRMEREKKKETKKHICFRKKKKKDNTAREILAVT